MGQAGAPNRGQTPFLLRRSLDGLLGRSPSRSMSFLDDGPLGRSSSPGMPFLAEVHLERSPSWTKLLSGYALLGRWPSWMMVILGVALLGRNSVKISGNAPKRGVSRQKTVYGAKRWVIAPRSWQIKPTGVEIRGF